MSVYRTIGPLVPYKPMLRVLEVFVYMRKLAFCICENKGADQLRSKCAADQRLCFHYIDSIIPLLAKPLAIFYDCTAGFVSDLV